MSSVVLDTTQYANFESESEAIHYMLANNKLACKYDDEKVNPGYIYAATFHTEREACMESISIQVRVYEEESLANNDKHVTFQCDVLNQVEQLLEKSLEGLEIKGPNRAYMLRVHGMDEYLRPRVPILDFRYVQECMKMGKDVWLVLVKRSTAEGRSWARTLEDDSSCLEMDRIVPRRPGEATHMELHGFLNLITMQANEIREKFPVEAGIDGEECMSGKAAEFLNPDLLTQQVKNICDLLGHIQTVAINKSVALFCKSCCNWNSSFKLEHETNSKPGPSHVDHSQFGAQQDLVKAILDALSQVEESAENLVHTYSTSFPASFHKGNDLSQRRQAKMSVTVASYRDTPFMVCIEAVHRLRPEWRVYQDFQVRGEVYHGCSLLGKSESEIKKATSCQSDRHTFFPSILYSCWIKFEKLPISTLPRESCLVLTLRGRNLQDELFGECEGSLETDELGWANIQCFDFKGTFVQGCHILPFRFDGKQKRLCSPSSPLTSSDSYDSLISIHFPKYDQDINFPVIIPSTIQYSGDMKTKKKLNDIVGSCSLTNISPSDRNFIWENRHHLLEIPEALPKVLLSMEHWDFDKLPDIYALLSQWAPMEPIDALQLLLPCFSDAKVREQAVRWISKLDNEELVTILPQLVEALSFEIYDISPLAQFLHMKSLCCLQVSHATFWILVSQVGLGKWEHASMDTLTSVVQPLNFDSRNRRLELMLNAFLITCGSRWRSALIAEYKMIQSFSDIAKKVKAEPSSSRNLVLKRELQEVNVFGGLNNFHSIPLPLSPSYNVKGIDVKSCHSFSSACCPIKVNFVRGLPEGGDIPIIFKTGDDLRKDMITIQIIRAIEKLWLREGLDLRVITFSCIPTGPNEGVVEMIRNSETLRKIQSKYGPTGVFKDKAITAWLAKKNPNPVDYKRAVENFTLTCAAYCVLTYVLGICDRHNDNIMLTNSGHLFHIDFGKILGDAQKFGGFNRDRTPFIFTNDMMFVISDRGTSPDKFQRFQDLCCHAFRIVRRNENLLVNLFALMTKAGIPGVDWKSAPYIQKALLPECSDKGANASFAKFIEGSSRSWFPQVNFFLHNLGQLKLRSGAKYQDTPMSLVPNTNSQVDKRRIVSATITEYKKLCSRDKYHSYIIEVKREGIEELFLINRTYEEFLELYLKLSANFPQASKNLKEFRRESTSAWWSNVKMDTDKRRVQMQTFLDSLFAASEEIVRSNLVSTFFIF